MKITLFLSAVMFALFASAAVIDVVPANNKVGLVLMKEVTRQNKEAKNIMTSPLSMYLALSLAYNGTASLTSQKLAHYLGSSEKLQLVNGNNKELQNTMSIEKKTAQNEWDPAPPVLGTYNSAWSNSNKSPSGGTFAFSANYVQVLKDDYDAEVQSLDFLDSKSADIINVWANDKTRGLITKVLDARTLEKMMWVLMNVTYLQANWEKPFYKMPQGSGSQFNLLDGSSKEVPMIGATGSYAHGKVNKVEFIEIPFYGTDLAFYIALPRGGKDFKSLNSQGAWTANFWKNILTSAKLRGAESEKPRGELQMPKFSFSYSLAMKKDEPLTKSVGLNFLFEDSADFSAMSSVGSVVTALGLIKQDTKIKLDEYGVKAAAVTTLGGLEISSMPAAPTYKMVVDRPFYFAIASRGTGALLFVGSVVDPLLTQ